MTYLVLLTQSNDDWPLLITHDEAKARKIAAETGPDVPEKVARVFRMDGSAPNCVKLVTFRRCDDFHYRPLKVEVVKTFD